MGAKSKNAVVSESVWVLRDSVSKTWFRRWTPIGPECTNKIALAATFATEQAAMECPAFTFALAFFEPRRRRT